MYLDMYLHIEFAGVVDLDWNAKALLTVIFCRKRCLSGSVLHHAKLSYSCIHYNVSML